MPTLPQYDSGNNINTTLGPTRDQSSQPFKDNAQVLGTLQDITQKLSDAHDAMQETRKKTATETSLLTLEQQAQNDPNPDNAETYIKQAQSISDKGAEGIDNQEVAQQVRADIQHTSFLTQIKIQDMFKGKQMLATKEAQQQSNVVAAQNIASPVSEAAAQNDYDNNMAQIRKLHATGVYSDAEAMGAEKEFKSEIVKAKISQNTSTNPEDYKGIDEGMGLDIKETSEMQKMIEAHIKQVKENDVTNTFQNRIKTLGGVASKQLDWKSADKINAIAAKDPALGGALQQVFDAQVNNKEDYEPNSKEGKEYADSVNKLMTGMTVEQVSEYLPKAIEQISKLPAGEMQDRLAVLVNAAEDRAKSLPVKDEQDIPPQVIQQEGGIQAVLRWNKEHGDNDPQTVNEYLKGIHSGKSPSDAYNDAIKTKIVKDHPEVAAQKDVPNRIINNDSKSFHIFSGPTNIYPARIWNEGLGRFEINPNREQSKNDNSSKQTNK